MFHKLILLVYLLGLINAPLGLWADELTVEIPQSPMATKIRAPLKTSNYFAEISLSSFSNLNIQTSTWASQTTSFTPMGPAVGFKFGEQQNNTNYFWGFDFLILKRQGQITTGGLLITETQKAYVGQLRMGLSKEVGRIFNFNFFGGLTVLPSLLMAQESAVGPKESTSFWDYELSVGARFSYLIFSLSKNLNTLNSSLGLRIPL